MLNDNTNNKMSLAIVVTTKTRAQWRTEADSRVWIFMVNVNIDKNAEFIHESYNSLDQLCNEL